MSQTIILDQYQKEVLEYEGDILLCTGRRVGKTYTLARKGCDKMIKKKTNIIIFSLTEEQAMIILAMAQAYVQEVAPSLISKKKIDTNKKTLTLKNGSRLKVRPAGDTGDSGRGFEADVVIVDEAARMGKYFWIAVLPIILNKGGTLWLASTPHGKQGYFWDRYNECVNLKDPEARFKVWSVTTEEVYNNRPITKDWTAELKEKQLKILAQDKKTMSSLEYGQEYQGLFLEDLMQYFTDDLIKAACTRKREETRVDYNIFMGCDLARYGGDSITYEIFHRKDNGKIIQFESIIKKNQPLTETAKQIKQLCNMWTVKKVGIDAGSGSIGVGVYDILFEDPQFRQKLVAMHNQELIISRDGKKQKILKEDMYATLKNLMETGEIHLLNDDAIIDSLKSVQSEYDKETGKLRIFGKNTHIVEGIIRAAYLARKQKVNKIWVTYM